MDIALHPDFQKAPCRSCQNQGQNLELERVLTNLVDNGRFGVAGEDRQPSAQLPQGMLLDSRA